jgi:predicted DsbA family dithiol-disulfide isomerase
VLHAEDLGLDVDRFVHDLQRHHGASRIDEDVDSADSSGVAGTPSFFVNGRRLEGAYDIAALRAAAKTARVRAAIKSAAPSQSDASA